MGTISESSRGPQSVRGSISLAEVSPDRKHRLPITHRGPHEKGILATYSDAATVEPYGRPDLNFESAINHLLSNSSYMPKAHDALRRLRKKVLPILTGCMNILSARLHAENVKPTPTTTIGQDAQSTVEYNIETSRAMT